MIMPRAICLTSDSIMDPIVVQQYDKDSRTVQLTVYETPGVLYDLTERSADVLYRVNGVNTPAYEARIVGENAVEFTVPGNIARNEGNCVVQVRFYHGEELLHTQLIPLIVRFSLTDGSGGEEDPTPAFVELLREARDAISQADAATANATEAANEANAAAEGLEEAKSAALNAASEAASEAAAARQAAVYANDAGTAAGEAKVDASQAAQAAIAAAEAAATQTNLARGATEEAINATTATRGATEEAGRQALNAMNAAEAANEAATTANTAANNADVQAESAANATMRALTAAGKPPIVNPATGTWRIWDDGAQAYKETTYRAQGPEGTRGFTPTITATRQEYGVLLHIENENSTETQMLYDGEDGKIDMNLQDGIAEGSVKIVGSKDEAEGYPIGKYATSFAFDGTAGGDYSHTEGLSTRAAGVAAHAEGNGSHASGDYSHAENESAATGRNSHAENKGSAEAENSHAEGLGTVASSMNQHAQGRYNVADDADIYAHIVGNGTSNADRSNAHTLDWNGNAWYAGNVYAGDVPSEANRLVRRSEMATGGGGIAGSGEPYQHMVTDINGNGKWEPREFYTAGGRRALMDGANLGTVGTIYTQIDASQLKELPEAGKSYVVVWKGKEYEVEPYAMTSGTLWIPMTGATEDVPFQFTISHNNGMITKVMVKAYESTDNVVCGIYAEEPESIVKLPPKYLPEGGVGYEDTDYVEVVDTVWEKEGDVHSGITLDTPLNMNLGEKYRVTWNGEVYETEVTEYSGMHGFGNMGSFSGIETAEPFAVVCFPEDVPDMENASATVFIVKGEDTRPVALKIEHMQHVVHKIDPKYLPDDIGGGGDGIQILHGVADGSKVTLDKTLEEICDLARSGELSKYKILVDTDVTTFGRKTVEMNTVNWWEDFTGEEIQLNIGGTFYNVAAGLPREAWLSIYKSGGEYSVSFGNYNIANLPEPDGSYEGKVLGVKGGRYAFVDMPSGGAGGAALMLQIVDAGGALVMVDIETGEPITGVTPDVLFQYFGQGAQISFLVMSQTDAGTSIKMYSISEIGENADGLYAILGNNGSGTPIMMAADGTLSYMN